MKNIIRILAHMIVWGTAMSVLSDNFGNRQEVALYCLGAMVLAATCCLFREKLKTLWIFLTSHLLLIIAQFVLVSVFHGAGWCKVFLALFIIYSALLRLVPSMAILEKPCKEYIVMIAVIYVILFIYKGTELAKGVCFWAIILLYLLKMLHENLEKMDNYVITRSLSAEIDDKRMKRLSTQLLLLYTGGIGTLICGMGLLSMDVVWDTIGGWLNRFIRFLVSLIPSTTELPETEVEKIPQKGEGLLDMLQKLDTDQSMTNVPEWIDQVGMVLAFGLIIVLLVSVVVGAIIVAYRYFYSRTKKEVSEQIVETLSDEEKMVYKKNKRFIERFERNPARRVRKIYKKKMKKIGMKQMIRFPYMSPDEQVQVLQENGYGESAVEEVRNLYEKARYGADVVTNAEADRMRSLL